MVKRASLSALLLVSGLLAAAAASPPEALSLPAEASPPDQAEGVDVPGRAVPVAGRGVSGYSGDGGVAVDAWLHEPNDVGRHPLDRPGRHLAVVRPGEMAGPFPWAPVGLASGGVLVLGVAAVFLVRRRRLDAAQTPESAQARSLA